MFEPMYTYHITVTKGKMILLKRVFTSYLEAQDYLDFIEERYGKTFTVEYVTKRKKKAA